MKPCALRIGLSVLATLAWTSCTSTKVLFCGDGEIQEQEECDDGDRNSASTPNACRPGCVLPTCGDGVLDDESEACDDGADNNDRRADACRTDCHPATCGDGVVDAEDVCDDGNDDETDGCLVNCALPTCGDGFVQAVIEECDDGEGNSDEAADACRSNCRAPHCGDGVTDEGEECDDDNVVETDACLETCASASCGDGHIQAGVEECDDADENSDDVVDACRTDCFVAHCGDDVTDTGEDCDDGNVASGDACPASCQMGDYRIGALASSGGSTSATGDTLFGRPVSVPTATTVTGLGFWSLGSPGVQGMFALYAADSGGAPSDLVASTAAMSIEAAGDIAVDVLVPAAIEPGDYWVFAVFDEDAGYSAEFAPEMRIAEWTFGEPFPSTAPASSVVGFLLPDFFVVATD